VGEVGGEERDDGNEGWGWVGRRGGEGLRYELFGGGEGVGNGLRGVGRKAR